VPLAEFSLRFGLLNIQLDPHGNADHCFVAEVHCQSAGQRRFKALPRNSGTDVVQGAPRFVYGITGLMDGISFVVVVMGVFASGKSGFR